MLTQKAASVHHVRTQYTTAPALLTPHSGYTELDRRDTNQAWPGLPLYLKSGWAGKFCRSLQHSGTSWFGLGLQRVTCLPKSSFPASKAPLQFLLTRPYVRLPAYIPSTDKKLLSSMFTHAQRHRVWKDKHQIADNSFLGGEIKRISGPSFCASASSLTEEDILLEFKQTNSFL